MPKYLFLFLYSFLYGVAYGQDKEPLSIDISADTSKVKGFAVFNIRLNNYSDSIICILRSPTIVLGVGFVPQELAAKITDSVRELYDLEYSAVDAKYDYEGPLFRGVIILPYEALNFKIGIPASKKEQFLFVEYINTYDLCYRDFVSSIKDPYWFRKYHLNSKKIAIPSKEK